MRWAVAAVDHRPPLWVPRHLVQQSLASDVLEVGRMIGVVEQVRAAPRDGREAAVAGTLPVFVGGQQRVRGMTFPWPEQLARSCDAQLVIASSTAARVGRIEKVEPLTAMEHERSFDEMRF